jgi:tryptophan-rich sensory protein
MILKTKIKWKELIISVAIPVGVGALSAALTMNTMKEFGQLNQPPLSPPAWLFPLVWSILYVLMGVSAYLVCRSDKPSSAKTALYVYGAQLFFNFLRSIIFFNMKAYLFAFLWLVALLVLVTVNAVLFYRINKSAGLLFIPYILWVTFAGYLNFAIYLLN